MSTATVNVGSDTTISSTAPQAPNRSGPEVQFPVHSEISAAFQGKLNRLVRGLLPYVGSSNPKAICFGEVGMGSKSALWLTTSVASTLGLMLGKPVCVLAVGSSIDPRGSGRTVATGGPYNTMIEPVPWPELDTGSGTVAQRLSELRAAEQTVLLHLPDAPAWINSAVNQEEFAGMVLLSRASHTRKSAVESLQVKLQQLRVPLLAAVLLDREYPIPERIYRLL